MSEIESYKQLTQAFKLDENYQSIVDQINDFEKFVHEMRITIEKKRILISREDNVPQIVYLNTTQNELLIV